MMILINDVNDTFSGWEGSFKKKKNRSRDLGIMRGDPGKLPMRMSLNTFKWDLW